VKSDWGANSKPKEESNLQTRPIALEQTMSLFTALLVACGIAVFVMVAEKIFHRNVLVKL